MIAVVVDMRELFVKERAEVVSFSLILQTRYLTGILVEKNILNHLYCYSSATGNSDGWMVTRLNGRVMVSGQGALFLNLPSGIYIVQQGDQTQKVVVK